MAGNMDGRGHAWWAACMTGGMHSRGACVAEGGHAWQGRRPLQLKICILLECILVILKCYSEMYLQNWQKC